MAGQDPADTHQLTRMTIELKPELLARIEEVRLQAGLRSRSALVAFLLEELLLGSETQAPAA